MQIYKRNPTSIITQQALLRTYLVPKQVIIGLSEYIVEIVGCC
jgi:hypothetical protein